MKLINALLNHPSVPIFCVKDSENENKAEWEVEPVNSKVLTESDTNDDFYIVKAKNILEDKSIKDCYIDISLPERISDYAYFLRDQSITFDYHHQFKGDIICSVPIDCFGVYELFYSRIAPDVGIEILKEGLSVSNRKCYIAEDLGYILRDEERYDEAAKMFQISADEEPSSYFIYGELADCYEKMGDEEKSKQYRGLFENEGGNDFSIVEEESKNAWWKIW